MLPELLDAVVSDVVAGLVDVSVVGVDGGSVVITVLDVSDVSSVSSVVLLESTVKHPPTLQYNC